MGRYRELFEIDLRSLAVFRIGLALSILADLTQRARDIGIHYSDAGILPREFLLSHPAIHAGALSLHALSGSEGWIGFLFAVHACAALALLLGFRTPQE